MPEPDEEEEKELEEIDQAADAVAEGGLNQAGGRRDSPSGRACVTRRPRQIFFSPPAPAAAEGERV